MSVDGVLSELPMPAPLIAARESSSCVSLPTPTAWDGARGPDNSRLQGDGLRPSGQQGTVNLAGALKMLPTPTTADSKVFGPNIDWKKRVENHHPSTASALMALRLNDGNESSDDEPPTPPTNAA